MILMLACKAAGMGATTQPNPTVTAQIRLLVSISGMLRIQLPSVLSAGQRAAARGR